MNKGAGTAEVPQSPLVLPPLPVKEVAANPSMADSGNFIHNDVYAADVTDAVAPPDT